MTDIKNQAQGLDANLHARDVAAMAAKTGNVYKSIAIVAKRSRQLSSELREELHQKLEEFATVTDTIEEVHENKEQIEISKFYERLPSPTIIALHEFADDELEYRNYGEDAEEDKSDSPEE